MCCSSRFGVTLVSLILLLCGSPSRAQESLPPVPEVFRGDPALEEIFSMSERRILIGDLLERLSERLETRLATSDRLAPISGYPVSVSVREVHGWELLDALPRAFTHGPDRWYWKRESRKGKRWYVLYNTVAPDAWRVAREEFIHRFLLDQRRKASAFFSSPPSERSRLAQSDPFLGALNVDPERSAGTQSLVDLLSDEQILGVMRGEPFRIPLSRLSPAQRAYVQQEVARSNPGDQGDAVQEVVFDREMNTGTLVLRFPGGAGVGGLGGNWSATALQQRASEGWVADGENQRAPDSPFPAPGIPANPEERALPMAPNFITVNRAAHLGQLNVVLDAAADNSYGSPRPVAHAKVSEVLHTLATFRNLLWKRRGRFLLFAPREWDRQDRAAETPWPTVKRLRLSAAAKEGYLSPEDWLLMAELSGPQLQRLTREFPDASAVRRVQGVLRIVAAMSETERTALGRPGGAGWDAWSGKTRQRLLVNFPEEEARRTQFYVSWQTDREPPQLGVWVGIGEGNPLVLKFQPRRDSAATPPPLLIRPPG